MQTNNPFDVILDKLERLQLSVDILSFHAKKAKEPDPIDHERIINLPEAAKILRKPVGTVRGYIHSRNLPATLVGKGYLIKHKDLLAWFEQFQKGTPQEDPASGTAPAGMMEQRHRYRKD